MKKEDLESFAERGDPYAAFSLGVIAEQVDANRDSAAQWYRRAATSTPLASAALAALLLFDGTRMQTSGARFDEGRRWAQDAADRGCALGYLLLGFLERAKCDHEDAARTMDLFLKAKLLGSLRAEIELASILIDVASPHYDPIWAEQLISAAFARGDKSAISLMALVHFISGRQEQGLITLRQGIAARDRKSLLHMAMLCRLGQNGVAIDKSKALSLEREADSLPQISIV